MAQPLSTGLLDIITIDIYLPCFISYFDNFILVIAMHFSILMMLLTSRHASRVTTSTLFINRRHLATRKHNSIRYELKSRIDEKIINRLDIVE